MLSRAPTLVPGPLLSFRILSEPAWRRMNMPDIESRKEAGRDAFVRQRLDGLRRDGEHALRRLAKDWQFSAGAIAILALGIGGNTAVFSILNNTLFQPHPFTRSERLVNLYQNDANSGEPEGVLYPAFLDLKLETAVFDGVAAANMTEGRYQTVDAQGRSGQYPRRPVRIRECELPGCLGHAAVAGQVVQRRRGAQGRACRGAGVDRVDS